MPPVPAARAVAGAEAPPDARTPDRGGGAEGGTGLRDRYAAVRSFTERLCEPLETEDYVVQTMEDVSPAKWHLAHVTWFFETFVLRERDPSYRPLDERYAYLFNSYYVQAGERHCRDRRGWISRPTVRQVYEYRAHVDEAVDRFLEGADEETLRAAAPVMEIGLNHEQQHQELLLTDLKHVLSVNPLRPAYRERSAGPPAGDSGASAAGGAGPAAEGSGDGGPGPMHWLPFEERLARIGHDGDGFRYDNETPRHRHFVDAFRLADRLVTCGEFMEFMGDGGYEEPTLWLSEGWAVREAAGWTEPFYWERGDDGWAVFTLAGPRPLDPSEPVSHVSYFEADAFARWAGARLPTEQEWEVAAAGRPRVGNLVETGALHPRPVGRGPAAVSPAGSLAGAPVVEARPSGAPRAGDGPGAEPVAGPDGDRGPALRQLYGDVWEWTRTQYSPYPGYAPPPGALGEYNGKFMSNQFVLRGGSCVTSASHVRPTYRNFLPADATWQFTGIRLARDGSG